MDVLSKLKGHSQPQKLMQLVDLLLSSECVTLAYPRRLLMRP